MDMLNIFGTLIVIISICIFIVVLSSCMWVAYNANQTYDLTQTEPISRASECPTEVFIRRTKYQQRKSSSVPNLPISRENNQYMELRELPPQQETNL